MKKNSLKKYFFLLILISLPMLWGINSYYISLLSPVSPTDKTEKRFIIYKGEGSNSIAEKLEKAGLIRSATVFKIYLRTSGQLGTIQAGEFKLSPSQSSEEIVKELKNGVVEKWVMLLEGWRVEEMAEKLNKELGISNEEFIKIAEEGYMFPDTYLLDPNWSASEIGQFLRNNFEKKINNELQDKIKKQGLTFEEGVILASIVEREARSDGVRRMVASILLKRLKIGMGLNADATIQYILGYQRNEKSWWKRHLTREDLKTPSRFNTYLHAGLPPAPIANPSLSSLKAVANADPATPYLYYYHDSKGVSHYGKTLEEHNQNVAEFP